MEKKTEITLKPALLEEAALIHEMKYRAFLPLYETYQDHNTNPAMETLEKTQEFSDRIIRIIC